MHKVFFKICRRSDGTFRFIRKVSRNSRKNAKTFRRIEKFRRYSNQHEVESDGIAKKFQWDLGPWLVHPNSLAIFFLFRAVQIPVLFKSIPSRRPFHDKKKFTLILCVAIFLSPILFFVTLKYFYVRWHRLFKQSICT